MKPFARKEATKITRSGGQVSYERMRFLTPGEARREVRAVDPAQCHHRLPQGNIYFIHAKATNAVKIGFSTHAPRVRFRELQAATADKLKLIGSFPGSIDDERGLHLRFAEYRIRGEWFRYAGEMREFVSEVGAG